MDDVSDARAQLLVGVDLLLETQLLGAQHVQLVRDPRQQFLLKRSVISLDITIRQSIQYDNLLNLFFLFYGACVIKGVRKALGVKILPR